MVSFIRENSLKTSHKGYVFGIYVSPEGKGKGLGKLLMIELIRMANNCDGLEHIIIELNQLIVCRHFSIKSLITS
ncbi:GNAT family N-acetyltransferase [Cytobacillus solani]|uniref:GNAT family N-acetyltransferase n=1 Tax=Cytobacillus solani TaxID=1637975 RepID=UPI0009E8E007